MSNQKILLVTFFYNPACLNPQDLLSPDCSMTEQTLMTQIDKCLEAGGLVRIRQETVTLLPVGPSDEPSMADSLVDDLPIPEWVGLTFIPLPEAALVRRIEEVTEDVPFL